MKRKGEHKSNERVIDVKVDTSELDVFIETLKEVNSLEAELASKNKRQGKTIFFFGDEEPVKKSTQWDKFKELLEEQNKALQEDNTEFIKQIQIDFEKEILIINGKEVKEPVIVALPYKGEWKRRKVFHPEHCKHGSLPEISVSIKTPDKLKY